MKVVSIDKAKRVDWGCLDGDPEWIGTHVSFELDEKDGKSGLLFTHANWKEATLFFANCSNNWGFYMNSLRELCNKGKGTPHQTGIRLALMGEQQVLMSAQVFSFVERIKKINSQWQ